MTFQNSLTQYNRLFPGNIHSAIEINLILNLYTLYVMEIYINLHKFIYYIKLKYNFIVNSINIFWYFIYIINYIINIFFLKVIKYIYIRIEIKNIFPFLYKDIK